jgi:hypothetical protein
MPTERDLFAEEQQMVSMSFGDHLEELRARLILALLGLFVGVLVTFIPPLNLGARIVRFMQDPAEKALKDFYQERAEARAEKARLKAKAERKALRKAEKLAREQQKAEAKLKEKLKAKAAQKAKKLNGHGLNGKSANGRHLNGNSRVRVTGRKSAGRKRPVSAPALQA